MPIKSIQAPLKRLLKHITGTRRRKNKKTKREKQKTARERDHSAGTHGRVNEGSRKEEES